MKQTLFVMLIILAAAGGVLWYIFVFGQSTTTLLDFNNVATVVGLETCAPRIDRDIEKDCEPAIKDDLGKYFINKTSNQTKLFMSDTVRTKGILIKPDPELYKDFKIDGVIVDTLPSPSPY